MNVARRWRAAWLSSDLRHTGWAIADAVAVATFAAALVGVAPPASASSASSASSAASAVSVGTPSPPVKARLRTKLGTKPGTKLGTKAAERATASETTVRAGAGAAASEPTTTEVASSAAGPMAAKAGPAVPTTISADTRFCRAAEANLQALLGGSAPLLAKAAQGGKAGADSLRAFIDKAQVANAALAQAAPPGMRQAMVATERQKNALVVALQRVDYDLTKLDPATLPAPISGPDAITAYLVTVCRLDPVKALARP